MCVSAGYVGVGVLLIRGFSHESWLIFVKIKNCVSTKSTDSKQENCHHTDGLVVGRGQNHFVVGRCGGDFSIFLNSRLTIHSLSTGNNMR